MKVFMHESPLALIESMYVYGLHNISRKLSLLFELNSEFLEIVNHYSASSVNQDYTQQENDQLDGVSGFGDFSSRLFLRNEAARLNPNSRILEVGTFIGASSLALLQGARKSNSTVTCVDLFTGFESYSRQTTSVSAPQHWEHMEWQKNTSDYADIVK